MKGEEHFKNKRITVMGLGLLGRGVGDAAYLAQCGAQVTVTDTKSKEELAASVEKLAAYPNITFVLGEHRVEDFENRDFILVSAGVPADSPYLAHAQKNAVPLTQSAALFAKLSGIPVIGVTGTRGKSTVTHMIHHVLEYATGEKVILGGNIRGVSNLQLLNEVHEESLAVMELDSWQLQAFGWERISPQIAVFTNFMEDHMSYYHDDMDAYFADKANIFLYQEEDGVLITTPEVFERAKTYATGKGLTLGQEVVLVDESVLPEDTLLSMPGQHNRMNAALAYEALKATSLSNEAILEGLASFPGVPGRLEYVRDFNGVKIYNDNNATTPAATIEALKTLAEDKNIVLIVGGTDKGLDVQQLAQKIEETCVHVVLYAGTGTDKLKEVLPQSVVFEEHEQLKDCVHAALAASVPGNVVLFSPAFSSFGKYYVNEYDRNDQFMDLVTAL